MQWLGFLKLIFIVACTPRRQSGGWWHLTSERFSNLSDWWGDLDLVQQLHHSPNLILFFSDLVYQPFTFTSSHTSFCLHPSLSVAEHRSPHSSKSPSPRAETWYLLSLLSLFSSFLCPSDLCSWSSISCCHPRPWAAALHTLPILHLISPPPLTPLSLPCADRRKNPICSPSIHQPPRKLVCKYVPYSYI